MPRRRCSAPFPGLPLGLLGLGLFPSLALAPAAARAEGQVQLRCDGTLVEARGSAERKRPTQRLRVSLAIEAEAAKADGALGLLQERLAAVRQGLQRLGVQELEVTSPSTWERPPSPRTAAQVTASVQVSGHVAPANLQALIRGVGGLSGVRLAPVAAEADSRGDAASRSALLRAAYQDALAQGRELAAAIGLAQLTPLEVQVEGGFRPMMARAMAAESAPPFDPAELPKPTERTSLLARFCAR
ncbi:SIMPL domain-containing protein [Cyanobium sp. Morenito 9A2]|uniref:SIMPL domain-containing protein n=1 Tax=Cyanobium sp. Morenito 9A2 TaxID=2823718 RepID=UPI0020CC5DE0|nr:SIMPL domain-containing protein [Cyanobium sp. Morenito 9A2]MCP9851211.1 SIMPL domain-containing protein [Cyanobium sp. Morenito 9A2]